MEESDRGPQAVSSLCFVRLTFTYNLNPLFSLSEHLAFPLRYAIYSTSISSSSVCGQTVSIAFPRTSGALPSLSRLLWNIFKNLYIMHILSTRPSKGTHSRPIARVGSRCLATSIPNHHHRDDPCPVSWFVFLNHFCREVRWSVHQPRIF